MLTMRVIVKMSWIWFFLEWKTILIILLGIINQNHVFEDIDLTDIRCRLENLINADIKNILPAKFDEEWLQFNLEYNKRDLEW